MTQVPSIGFDPAPRASMPRRAASAGWREAAAPRDEAAPAAGTDSPLSLDGMLALQAGADSLERDRRARQRGAAILDDLAALQRALLGGDTSEVLAHLESLAGDAAPAADPGLSNVVAAIRLRARVELARRNPR